GGGEGGASQGSLIGIDGIDGQHVVAGRKPAAMTGEVDQHRGAVGGGLGEVGQGGTESGAGGVSVEERANVAGVVGADAGVGEDLGDGGGVVADGRRQGTEVRVGGDPDDESMGIGKGGHGNS